MCECWKRCSICVYDFNGFHMRKTFIFSFSLIHTKNFFKTFRSFFLKKNNNNPQVFHFFPLFLKKRLQQKKNKKFTFLFQLHFHFFHNNIFYVEIFLSSIIIKMLLLLLFSFILSTFVLFSHFFVSLALSHTKSFLLFFFGVGK